MITSELTRARRSDSLPPSDFLHLFTSSLLILKVYLHSEFVELVESDESRGQGTVGEDDIPHRMRQLVLKRS